MQQLSCYGVESPEEKKYERKEKKLEQSKIAGDCWQNDNRGYIFHI